MTLTLDDLMPHLARSTAAMRKKSVQPVLVTHIGDTTEPLGKYFAGQFHCPLKRVPSLQRKGRSARTAAMLNGVYQHVSPEMLYLLSYGYRLLYQYGQREFPREEQLPFQNGEYKGNILLVDDNSYTGRTLEAWKTRMVARGREVTTFAVTATGDYKPDFYCFEHWQSFAWRPIGI